MQEICKQCKKDLLLTPDYITGVLHAGDMGYPNQ